MPELAFSLNVATVEETVTVTAETPVVDPTERSERGPVQRLPTTRCTGAATHWFF